MTRKGQDLVAGRLSAAAQPAGDAHTRPASGPSYNASRLGVTAEPPLVIGEPDPADDKPMRVSAAQAAPASRAISAGRPLRPLASAVQPIRPVHAGPAVVVLDDPPLPPRRVNPSPGARTVIESPPPETLRSALVDYAKHHPVLMAGLAGAVLLGVFAIVRSISGTSEPTRVAASVRPAAEPVVAAPEQPVAPPPETAAPTNEDASKTAGSRNVRRPTARFVEDDPFALPNPESALPPMFGPDPSETTPAGPAVEVAAPAASPAANKPATTKPFWGTCPPDIRLTAIIGDPKGNVALLNGQFLRAGETLHLNGDRQAVVIEITTSYALLEMDLVRFYVRFGTNDAPIEPAPADSSTTAPAE